MDVGSDAQNPNKNQDQDQDQGWGGEMIACTACFFVGG